MAASKQPPCPGHGRHWFTLHGVPGGRTPVCVRCGAENPKPLKPDEWAELEGMMRDNYRLGSRVERAVRAHQAGARPGEPFAVGTRVHHRGAVHSVGKDPEDPDGGYRPGWAEVLESKEQGDGTYEYVVDGRRSAVRGESVTQWGSHHIDRALPPP